MSGPSKIEWTERTWNPVRGCTRVSRGCGGPGPHGGCYAEGIAARFSKPGQPYHGIAEMRDGKPRWTGKLAFSETALLEPLKRRRPTTYFVNSMSDLFHEKMPEDWIDRVFAVMALSPQHTFQVLTKRPARMRTYLTELRSGEDVPGPCLGIIDAARALQPAHLFNLTEWPLPNVWLGTSCEDQATADARVPELLATPAAVRFVSAEPLLGPIDFARIELQSSRPPKPDVTFDALKGWYGTPADDLVRLDWIIVGGESGPHARPMHPDWARSIRDQCAAADVPFLFKQRGAWSWLRDSDGEWPTDAESLIRMRPDGTRGPDGWPFQRVGKKVAGRLLDDVEHNGMPEVHA